MKNKSRQKLTVTFEKLVHGGEALGFVDGKAVFAFNALPGETAIVELTKNKKDFATGIAIELLKTSPDRIAPTDPLFAINSPWQILKYDRELFYKKEILKETFSKLGKIDLPEFEIKTDGKELGYRNKMEFNFCSPRHGGGESDGKIALAFYERGTHHKIPVDESILADEVINKAARQIVKQLNTANVDARALKALILRSDGHNVLAALFIKTDTPLSHCEPNFWSEAISLNRPLVGIEIYQSNWRSPASTPDKLSFKSGEKHLEQNLSGKKFIYNALSFFQVNVPIYEMALQQIAAQIGKDAKVVDMYCGVGSIGIATNNGQRLLGVDNDANNIELAKTNALNNKLDAKFICAADFKATNFIDPSATLILDPPRAGIHKKLMSAILEKLPKKIIYLSCNPSTQARDMELLKQHYDLVFFEAYNFFPRTPHIESLAVLTR
jgi:23S rRNA (uracil-5-)-methyltransferase RumA